MRKTLGIHCALGRANYARCKSQLLTGFSVHDCVSEPNWMTAVCGGLRYARSEKTHRSILHVREARVLNWEILIGGVHFIPERTGQSPHPSCIGSEKLINIPEAPDGSVRVALGGEPIFLVRSKLRLVRPILARRAQYSGPSESWSNNIRKGSVLIE